ncbi:MAG: GNAT family N-acetyltransferase [Planctomycetota bacterium]
MGPSRTPTAWHVAAIDDLDTLAAWGPAWDDLALRTRPAQPTLSYSWVRAQLEHLQPAGTPWCVTFASRGTRVVGVLPLVRAAGARGVGRWLPVLRSLADDHTPIAGPLLGEVDDPHHVLELLVRAHFQRRPHPASIVLEGLTAWSPASIALREGLPPWRVQRFADVAEGSTVDARVPYAEHLAALSGNARSQLRRAAKAIGRQGRLRFEIEDGRERFAERFEAYKALEASGWKGRAGTALAHRPRDEAFFRALYGRLANAGHLRWHLLSAGEQPVAMEVIVRFGRRVVVHKVAYDEMWRSSSPGHVVWSHTLEAACEDPGIRTVDLLTYDSLADRWKAVPYPYDRVLIHRTGLVPLLFAHAPSKARAAVRRWSERWRERQGNVT